MPRKNKRGFTLIEILIVIAVTSILSSMIIVYGGAGRRLTALTIESAKIAEVIERAKSRSTFFNYNQGEFLCGYGVHFDVLGKRYALFKYRALSKEENCEVLSSIEPDRFIELNSFSLPVGIEFRELSESVNDILFIPPDPKTVMFKNSARVFGSHEIHIAVDDDSAERIIQITSGGQISF